MLFNLPSLGNQTDLTHLVKQQKPLIKWLYGSGVIANGCNEASNLGW
jgi:hypothetical protein